MAIDARLGFRIVGPCTGERRLIDLPRAFAAYCAADVPGGVEHEAYLSAFTFSNDFRDHLNRTGSTKGYDGEAGAAWLWFDLDRNEASGGIEAALSDARRLCVQLIERFTLCDESLLAFYSGSKGFHVGLPLGGFTPEAGPLFHRIARRFADQVADNVGIVIDAGIYDKVRAFRAPNSKHPKTGRHKRRFTVDELLHLPASRIVELAGQPGPFDLGELDEPTCSFELPAAWNQAADTVQREAELQAERFAAVVNGDVPARLNRSTLNFIRDGASTGDRHRLLFSAAANLAECGAPLHLCCELLGEAALDSGLSPAEVERQIQCGHEHATKCGAA
jgi:hypothetical protein